MKTLRQFCAASVLTLSLACSVFAGDITTGVTSTPPPPATLEGQLDTPSLQGQMSTTVSDEAAEESLFGAAMSLLQGALSLF